MTIIAHDGTELQQLDIDDKKFGRVETYGDKVTIECRDEAATDTLTKHLGIDAEQMEETKLVLVPNIQKRRFYLKAYIIIDNVRYVTISKFVTTSTIDEKHQVVKAILRQRQNLADTTYIYYSEQFERYWLHDK